MPGSSAPRDVLLGLHRRRQRLERAGEIRDVLVGRLADRVGELARLGAVTAEQDNADIEVVLQRRSFLPKGHPASIVNWNIIRARQGPPGKFLAASRIEIKRGTVPSK